MAIPPPYVYGPVSAQVFLALHSNFWIEAFNYISVSTATSGKLLEQKSILRSSNICLIDVAFVYSILFGRATRAGLDLKSSFEAFLNFARDGAWTKWILGAGGLWVEQITAETMRRGIEFGDKLVERPWVSGWRYGVDGLREILTWVLDKWCCGDKHRYAGLSTNTSTRWWTDQFGSHARGKRKYQRKIKWIKASENGY